MTTSVETLSETREPKLAGDTRPSLELLTRVELRKMIDTRSGFWLPIAVAAITLVTVIIAVLAGHPRDHTTIHVFHAAVMPGSFPLPVLGVLLVCSEWSQRTTLNTFTLVPDRGRVVAAKLLAAVVLSIGLLIVCVVLSYVFGLILGNAPGGAGGIPLAVIGQGFVFLAVSMLIGVGFGAAILVSAPGIVAYFLLPIVWGALGTSINALSTADKWLDFGTTMNHLSSHAVSALQWGRIGVSLLVWLALPLTIGWLRIRRNDIG